MSIPVKYCLFVDAFDHPEAFAKFHPTMYRNLKGGHFTVFPCNHDPPCRPLTRAEEVELFERFRQPPPEPVR